MMAPLWSSLQQRLSPAFPAGSLRARLAGGAAWSLAGAVTTQSASTLAAIVCARVVGEVGFGELGMTRNTLVMFAMFAALGMGLTANKYVAELRASDPMRAGRILGLSYAVTVISGVLMTIMALALASPLARRYLNNPDLAHYIRISAPILLTGAISGVQSGALAGFEAFRRSSIASSLVALGAAVLTVVGVWVAGIEGALWSGVISGVVGMVVLQRVVAAECRRAGVSICFRGMRSESRLVWSFALPSLLSGVMVTPVIFVATAMLVNRPRGYAELGVFNAANTWRNLILFAPVAIGQVALPMLSNLQASGELGRYVRALKMSALLNLAAALTAALPVMLLSPWIIALYGPGFRGNWLVVVLLALSGVMHAVGNVTGQALASLGRMWWSFALNGLWAVQLLVATRFLLHLGAHGLAWAYLISYSLLSVQLAAFTWWLLRHGLRLPSPDAGGATERNVPAVIGPIEGAPGLGTTGGGSGGQ